MSDLGLGKRIFGHPERDAIHVAVVPVRAEEHLDPGDHIGLLAEEGGGFPLVGKTPNTIGIVDPYLNETMEPGDVFWMFLYPGSITSLRHDWTHPAFEKQAEAPKPDRAKSEAWLRDFSDQIGLSYDRMIQAAVTPKKDESADYDNGSSNDGKYLTIYGNSVYGDIPEEFWEHVQVVAQVHIPDDRKAKYFSCSC